MSSGELAPSSQAEAQLHPSGAKFRVREKFAEHPSRFLLPPHVLPVHKKTRGRGKPRQGQGNPGGIGCLPVAQSSPWRARCPWCSPGARRHGSRSSNTRGNSLMPCGNKRETVAKTDESAQKTNRSLRSSRPMGRQSVSRTANNPSFLHDRSERRQRQ